VTPIALTRFYSLLPSFTGSKKQAKRNQNQNQAPQQKQFKLSEWCLAKICRIFSYYRHR